MEKRGIRLIGRLRKREVKIKWKECWLWDYKTWWDIRQVHQSSTFQIVEKKFMDEIDYKYAFVPRIWIICAYWFFLGCKILQWKFSHFLHIVIDNSHFQFHFIMDDFHIKNGEFFYICILLINLFFKMRF
jgi:hypothetical protein